MKKNLLSIVIPCYGSERYLRVTVDELIAFFSPTWDFEIILVNDGSPDQVQRVIEELHRADPRIRYLELRANSGQHAATLRGFHEARGDVVVTVDDDGQNPPESVRTVVHALLAQDMDVVYGRFRTKAHDRFRTLASALNQWLSQRILGSTGVSLSNVRAMRGDLARLLGAQSTAFPFLDSMIFRATRHATNVDIEHRSRTHGASNYTLSKLTQLWLSHMTMLSVLPIQVATVGCFMVAMLGLSVGIWRVIAGLLENTAPPGWLSLFCATTFLFGLLFSFLGVLSLYIGRMYVSQNLGRIRWERRSEPRPAGHVPLVISEGAGDAGPMSAERARDARPTAIERAAEVRPAALERDARAG